MSSSTIGPTAHYTGYVWARNGLSHAALSTVEGRVLFESLQPAMVASRLTGGPALEPYLLARHRAIDVILEDLVDSGEVTQVIEVACGLSPRGWRLRRQFGSRLTYIEADLPEMAERKRAALQRIGVLGQGHRVEVVDVLRDRGTDSLSELAHSLDPDRGLALVTEGLLGYLDRDDVLAVWRRFAGVLDAFPHGHYISDLHLGSVQTVHVLAFRVLLSAFVRGRVHLHFDSAEQVREQLLDSGFREATVRRASELARGGPGPGSELAHILDASTK